MLIYNMSSCEDAFWRHTTVSHSLHKKTANKMSHLSVWITWSDLVCGKDAVHTNTPHHLLKDARLSCGWNVRFDLVFRTQEENVTRLTENIMVYTCDLHPTNHTRLNLSAAASVSVLYKQYGERGTAQRQA